MSKRAEGPSAEAEVVEATLRRTDVRDTQDQPLWAVIRSSTSELSFARYASFHEREPGQPSGWTARIGGLRCLVLAVAFLLIGLLLGAILI
jgi:hypothetical protein